jgi:hypothetical protein
MAAVEKEQTEDAHHHLGFHENEQEINSVPLRRFYSTRNRQECGTVANSAIVGVGRSKVGGYSLLLTGSNLRENLTGINCFI